MFPITIKWERPSQDIYITLPQLIKCYNEILDYFNNLGEIHYLRGRVFGFDIIRVNEAREFGDIKNVSTYLAKILSMYETYIYNILRVCNEFIDIDDVETKKSYINYIIKNTKNICAYSYIIKQYFDDKDFKELISKYEGKKYLFSLVNKCCDISVSEEYIRFFKSLLPSGLMSCVSCNDVASVEQFSPLINISRGILDNYYCCSCASQFEQNTKHMIVLLKVWALENIQINLKNSYSSIKK